MPSDRVSRKRQSSAFAPMNAMQQTERRILNAERENIKHAVNVADYFNHSAMEYAQNCMNQFNACFQSGNASTSRWQGVARAWADSYSEAVADYTESYGKALSCRSAHEMMDIQFGLMHRASSRYFDMGRKMRNELFRCCEQAASALGACAA